MGNKREVWIDKIKGLAILLVILGHISETRGSLQNWIYSFHMPLFFCVSGYLYSVNESRNTSMKMKEYIKRKAVSLMYPYFTYAIIGIVYQLFRFRFEEVKDALYETISLQGYSTLWFLPTLFFAELIFHILLKIDKKTLIVFSATIFISSFLIQSTDICIVILFRICIGVVFLFCGHLLFILKTYKNYLSLNKVRLICTLILLINVFLACENGFVDLHYAKLNNVAFFWWGSIVTSVCIMIILSGIKSKRSVLAVAGKHSLSIMCISSLLPIIGMFESLFGKLITFDRKMFIVCVWLLSCICSVLGAIIIDTYIKIIVKCPNIKREKMYEK